MFQVKLWDVSKHQPSLVTSQNINAGAIFSASFCGPDAPFLVAAAGDKGEVVVWDILASPAVAKAYARGVHVPQIYQVT